jgi:beta-glucosidase
MTIARTTALALLLATSACATTEVAPLAANLSVEAAAWPSVRSSVRTNRSIETRIDALLARMSVEDKVAQLIQPETPKITPAELGQFRFGSILNGGNGGPGPNSDERAPAAEWLRAADAYWEASRAGSAGRDWIPPIWGIDAVHGHANIIGATIFPHNIGLGAMRNPDLVRRIGEVTAREIAVTGIDWDFSPTLAVVRDDRWGRTYEGFSEDPEIVASYAGAMVEGLQGRAGTRGFLGAGRVIATAKHFVGDGGTLDGKDQGDNPSTPQDLARIHGAGYPPAIRAGVQSVMISFSSVRGEKTTGDRDLITDALKGRMNFDGLVVGDWNAHAQVPGCSLESCAAAINAGLDMFMAPENWRGLHANTVAQVRSGEIPQARLDDAVRRILRVKMRAGLFDKPKPSLRPLAGQVALLGAPEHRAVARQAVRESLVLLKNSGKLLPLRVNARVLVAGDGADNIGKQSGGWTISWQGADTRKTDFPNAQSIYGGIQEAVAAGGGTATLSPDGSFTAKPDVAIVVFGEEPYAEFVGDRPNLEYSPADKKDLALLRRLKAAGIPVVSVFLSGRPMWVNPELNASDAFVAAFLPGSEGGGVADVLFRRGARDFKGKLSYSWPRRADQGPINRGDANYDPLFAYGHGLTYASAGELPQLPEERPRGVAAGADGLFFGRGTLPAGWSFAAAGGAALRSVDRRAQEDARALTFSGAGEQSVALQAAQPIDLSRESNGDISLIMEYRVDTAPTGPVDLALGGRRLPIAGALRAAGVGRWTEYAVPLNCFAKAGADMSRVASPFTLSTSGRLGITISDVRLAFVASAKDCGRP